MAKEGALGGASTAQRTFDGFKGGMRKFLIWTLPSPTHLFVLTDDDSGIYDDTNMVSKGYLITLEKKMILPHMRNISKYKFEYTVCIVRNQSPSKTVLFLI